MNPEPIQPSPESLELVQAVFRPGVSLMVQKAAAHVLDAHVSLAIRQLMTKVETDHFRTNEDTGANLNALTVWNCLRRHAGLPYISRDDLPAYDGTADAYLMPSGSRLLTNDKGAGTV